MQKRILCFGDSNTYGFDHKTWGRYDYADRWPGALQKLLGPEYQIIEEGQCGRTTVFEDPTSPGSAGSGVLPVLLGSHRPLDLVILCLGTNDLKRIFNTTAVEVAKGMGELVRLTLRHDYGVYKAPQVLVLSPILIGEGIEDNEFFGFGRSAVAESARLAGYFKNTADVHNCLFMDASGIAAPAGDRLHLDKAGHAAMARALADKIWELF